jgi:hypothetical protein
MSMSWTKDIRFGSINGPAICFDVTWDTSPGYGSYVGFEVSCRSVILLLGYLKLTMWWWFK